MGLEIGKIEAIFRYPIKSMAGEPLESAPLGWHGIEGDRRLALRRMDDRAGFPWLTATKLPELLRFYPLRRGTSNGNIPTHVRTPENQELPVFGEELVAEIQRRFGSRVEMMHFKHGIFDDASLSVIASETIREVARLTGLRSDYRRFRPNVVVRLLQPIPFVEDEWVGGILSFGDSDDGPAISATMHDVRCSVVNLDPDSASSRPEVMKTIVRVNKNHAGVYGTVIRIGRLAVGQSIFFQGKVSK